MFRLWAFVSYFIVAIVAPARADEAIVIVDDRPPEENRDRARALGDAPFITIVHPDEHPAAASVADGIGETAGAQVRSFGGAGSYQSVSIRGASPGHTTVAIDGVPLARLAAVTTDLGRFALDSFGRVDVYRGTVPIELGGAGVGGAIDLVTLLGRGPHGERLRVSLGAGSYGSHHLRARYGDDHGRYRSATTIGVASARGDYRYFDNAGTPLNLRDDTSRERTNNGFDQLDAASRIGRTDGWFATGVRLAYKDQGLPGSTDHPTYASRLATLDAIADVHAGPVVAYALAEHQTLADPDNELGLGAQHRGYVTLAGGASAHHAIALADHRLELGGELRAERFFDEDLDHAMPTVDGARVAAAALASFDLALTRDLVVTPAVRVDGVRTAPAATTVGLGAFMPVPARVETLTSPRLGVRALLTPDLAVKGSAGYYTRLPTLLELFGNRGFLLGSPELRAETGPSTDVGVVYAPSGSRTLDRIVVEATAFGTRARDTIAFLTYGGAVTRAENIGTTMSYGAELTGSVRIARAVSLTANYTRLGTAQLSRDVAFDGKAIPRTPGHVVHAHADVAGAIAHHATSAWLAGEYRSTSFLDAANYGRVPARVIASAGGALELYANVSIALSVDNLANTRTVDLPLDPPAGPSFTTTPVALTDVAGFPLPGRSFYVALQWTH